MGQGDARSLCPAEKRQAGQAAFPPEGSANYILMELWMIWNMVPYLWYRLVIVKFDLK